MSTPINAAEIREALEATMKNGHDICDGPSCTGCWKDDVHRALTLLADMDGGGEVVNTQAIIDAAVECFDLGPEDQDDVLRFGMRLEDMNAPPDPDAHITDQEQYIKAKQERAKGVDFEDSRTPVDLWISVKDRLPEDSRTVLVRMPNGTPKLAWYMDTSQGQSMWFDPSTDCRMYPVKWMEIPE